MLSQGQATFYSHVMRRQKLQHLVTTGMIGKKIQLTKQQEKMLDRLTKLRGVGQMTDAVQAIKN